MTRREWLQLSAACTLSHGGLNSPLALAQEPAKPKSADEMIHAYLAAEAKKLTRGSWTGRRRRRTGRRPGRG